MMTKRIIRWETPFTDIEFPSAVIITGPHDRGCPVEVVIAPFGIDKYPKYVISFGDSVAFTCMEEMHFPQREFAAAEFEEEGLSAYEYIDSAWLESYRCGENFLFNTDFGNKEKLRHFLIFGGDNNIEVISKNTPTFCEVKEARVESRAFVI